MSAASSRTSTVRVVERFPSPPEGFDRKVRIWRPPHAKGPLPVLVLNDGQNIFDDPTTERHKSWRANKAMEKLLRAGRIEPWLLVAVDHGLGRFEEYTPWAAPPLTTEGRADRYVEFVCEHLLPWVEANYETVPGREARAMAGSSLGGLVSLHAGRTRPEVFSRIGALSPTVMWGGGKMFADWDRKVEPALRIWMDVGGRELFELGDIRLDYPREVPRFERKLRSLGYRESELKFLLDPRGGHDENDWARRLPTVLEWLLRR